MAPTFNHTCIIIILLAVFDETRCAASAFSPRKLHFQKSNTHGISSRLIENSSSLHAFGHPINTEFTDVADPDEPVAGLPRRRLLGSLPKTFIGAILLFLTTPRTSNATTKDPKTGVLLPSVGEIESSIPRTWDEDDNPLSALGSSSFARLDSSPDIIFYSEPRLVEHVDEQAVESMTSFISDGLLKPGDSVLDLCSSWTSHIRPSCQSELNRVAGLGMNAAELKANRALTEWTVMDLNGDGNVKLPYSDDSFDVILLQLSVDYLIHPLEVMRESSRVLKRKGKIAILFSNRLFLQKAIGLWTGSDDIEHTFIVASFLHFCDGGFTNIQAEDLSTRKRKGKEQVIVGDPLYAVTATKG